jgi:hypothetical protein
LFGAGLTDELDALLVDPDWLAGRPDLLVVAGDRGPCFLQLTE